MPDDRAREKTKTEVLDPQIALSMNDYIESVCEQRQKKYHSDLQPFSVEKERIRVELHTKLVEFERSYSEGYKAILDVLKKDPAVSLSGFEVQAERLAIFEDPEKLHTALQEGKFVYELLGFSAEVMTEMYHAAYRLLESSDYQKAKNAFYFLTCLAPHAYLFWQSLGYCYSKLDQHEAAYAAFQKALEIDPTQVDSYIGAIHAAAATKNIEAAKQLCDRGIERALLNPSESWSQPLIAALKLAKSMLGAMQHAQNV